MAKLCAGYERSGWSVKGQKEFPAHDKGPLARMGKGTFVRRGYRLKSVAAT
jgi:hypothetical protein